MRKTSGSQNLGYLLVFLSGFCWGTIGLFIKQLTSCGASPEVVSLMRIGFSFLIMLLVCLLKLGPRRMLLPRRNLVASLLLGIITQAIYNLCYSRAVTLIGVSFSSVLLYLSPIFTLLFSMLLFRERLSLWKAAAIALNILGCILTVTNGTFDLHSLAMAGIVFGVLAGFCYSLAAIFGRLATEGGNPLLTAMYSFLFATIFLLLRMVLSGQSLSFSQPVLAWGFFYALIPTSFTYIIYYTGLEMIQETSKVPVLASVEVVVATLIGIFLYHEQIGLCSLVGIVLVLSSIMIINCKRS